MANTLLTPQVIAREALATLYAQTVMLPLVHRDYSNEFAQVGDTVTIRKPAVFTAEEFTNSINVQNATENSVPVVMDKHYDVSFAVTSKEMALTIENFSEQFVAPAMEAHAQNIDRMLLALYADVYANVGTAGNTPDAVEDITNTRQVLSDALVPMTGRRLVINPAAENKFLQLEAFTNSGWNPGSNGDALSEASLGRKFGFDIYVGQNVRNHSNGSVAHTGNFAVNGAVNAGATTMNVDASTLTGTWTKGSLFTVAGVTGTFVVTANAVAAGNALTGVTFAPAAPAGGFGNDAVITRVAGHAANLAFHESAFAFVSRPLSLPMGSARAEVVSYKGLSVRVVYDYSITTKTDTISLDILFGTKTLDPTRAVRLLG